jgi:predicted nucleic acid-binding Zn ribbon protein
MPFCPNCGAEVSEEAQFCPECGRRLTTEQKVKRMSKKKIAGIIVGSIIGLIIIIAIIAAIVTSTGTYTLSVNANPSGAGSVSPSGGEYKSGVQLTLTASPASGYTFDYWSGAASGTTSTIVITMDSDKDVTANFVKLPVSTELIPVTQSTELISRTYQWTYGGKQWTWELQLPQALYDYYRGLPRYPTAKSDYSVYVSHPLDNQYINMLVSKIRQVAQQEGFSQYQTVSFTAAFVQSLPYTSDLVTTGYDEYPRYPIETLVDNGGDCEDTAILMASLLSAMDYGVVLLVFLGPGVPAHCAVGVLGGEGIYGTYWEHNGGKYYYLETTNTGWEIGQVPQEYRNAQAYVYDILPVPILTHSWTSKSSGTSINLEVTVSNLGSAVAQGVYVYAGFDAGNNQCWNAQKSPSFQIGVDEKVTASISLRVPSGKHTRLIVQVVYGGYAVDQSYSEWFDT